MQRLFLLITLIGSGSTAQINQHQQQTGTAPPTPAFSGAALNAKPSKTTLPNRTTIRAYFPKDRCKPGRIVFSGADPKDPKKRVSYECPVLGRGQTVYGNRPPVKDSLISDAADSKNTMWKCGTTPEAKSCCYVSPNFKNGATPSPKSGFQFWLDGTRANTTSYGKLPLSCMNFKDQKENVGNRTELRLHSGRESNPFLSRHSFGCIRVDPGCQQFFNREVAAITGQTPDCSRVPSPDKLITLEVIEE